MIEGIVKRKTGEKMGLMIEEQETHINFMRGDKRAEFTPATQQ